MRPVGSKLFIGWYDRHHDSWNHRIRVRGMISTITAQNPLTSQSFFDISAEDFATVFTGSKDDGTQESPGTFDPVYGAFLEIECENGTHPVYGEDCNLVRERKRCFRFEQHMGDYDQVVADSSYIYTAGATIESGGAAGFRLTSVSRESHGEVLCVHASFPSFCLR